MYFSNWWFALVSGLIWVCAQAFKSGFSIPYSFIVFLNAIPLPFRAGCFGGLSLLCSLRVEIADLRLKFFTSQGKISFPFVTCHGWGVILCLVSPYLCFTFLPQHCPFIPCCGSSVHSNFQVPFRGNYSMCRCRLIVCVWDQLRILLCLHLEPKSLNLFWFVFIYKAFFQHYKSSLLVHFSDQQIDRCLEWHFYL